MLRNRLKELMTERNLKASRVANDIPNLSRNTINTVANNKGKMLQLETINSLCEYLEISPSDFFEYLPFDIDIKLSADEEASITVADSFTSSYAMKPFFLNLYLTQKRNSQLSGFNSKTFELSILAPDKITFTRDLNSFVDTGYSPDKPVYVWDVLIGNPPTEDTFNEQKEAFLNFWNNELTPGFQTLIQEEIRNKTIDYFENNIISNAEFLNWKTFYFHLNYRFDNSIYDFKNCPKGKIEITSTDFFDVPFE